MLVRFWGTRGSIPVGAAGGRAAEEAGRRARRRPSGKHARHDRRGRRGLRRAGVPGRRSHLRRQLVVRGDRDGRRRVRAVRHRQRRARVRQSRARARTGRRSGQTFHVFMSHLHWDHIMGFPFFMPAYIPGQHASASTAATPALEEAFRRQHGGAVLPGGLLAARRAHRVRAARAGARATRSPGSRVPREAAAPRRRLLRLPLRARRQGGRLLDRLRAQARGPGGDRRVRGVLPRTPTS